MKINKKSKKISNPYLALSAIAVIIFAGIGVYFFWQNSSNQNKATNDDPSQQVNLDPPTADQIESDIDTKASAEPTNISTTFSTTITSANVNDDVLQIRTIISGAISNAGTCDLTLTKSGDIVTKTAPTYAMPTYSTCQGFDINSDELSTGTWTININVTVDSEVSTATSEVIID